MNGVRKSSILTEVMKKHKFKIHAHQHVYSTTLHSNLRASASRTNQPEDVSQFEPAFGIMAVEKPAKGEPELATCSLWRIEEVLFHQGRLGS